MNELESKLIVNIKGGLGNQMFQYAFFLALKKEKRNVYLDISWFENNKDTWPRPLYLKKAFNIKFETALSNDLIKFKKQSKPPFLFRVINRFLRKFSDYQLTNKNKSFPVIVEDDNKYPENYYFYYRGYLDGYWQSEKYFLNIKDDIRNVFSFKKSRPQKVNEIEKLIKRTSNNTSLHWRRGDYINHSSLEVITDKYMVNALKYLIQNKNLKTVFVFSEDYAWVKEKLESFKLNLNFVLISELLVDVEDYHEMFLMSICENNIISNSSFSWWGAYLNQNKDKTVIAPNKWTNTNTNIRFKDIIPNEWIKIEV